MEKERQRDRIEQLREGSYNVFIVVFQIHDNRMFSSCFFWVVMPVTFRSVLVAFHPHERY